MRDHTLERDLSASERELVEQRTHEFVTLMAEAMGDDDEACFQYPFADQVEEIERESRSGFIPWTHGGHHVVLAAALSHHWGTGAAPAPVQPLIDAGGEIIASEWARQYPERPSLIDCICSEPDLHPDLFGGETPLPHSMPDSWRRAAEDFESESWANDDDCYYWKARAMILSPRDRQNQSGDWEVYVDAYLCTDSYGRDSIPWLSCYGQKTDQTVGDWKRTVPMREFMAMDSDALERMVEEARRTLP